MTNDDINLVKSAALAFRQAIENSKPTLSPILFGRFPLGSCGAASGLLARYLSEIGLGNWTEVYGSRNGRSHAWLEKDGLIVDITADQFSDGPHCVFVDFDRTWHDQFQPQTRSLPEAGYELRNTYNIVVAHTENRE